MSIGKHTPEELATWRKRLFIHVHETHYMMELRDFSTACAWCGTSGWNGREQNVKDLTAVCWKNPEYQADLKADAERYRKLKALATDHGWTYHVTNRNESSNGFYQRHMFSLDANGFDESVDKLEVPE